MKRLQCLHPPIFLSSKAFLQKAKGATLSCLLAWVVGVIALPAVAQDLSVDAVLSALGEGPTLGSPAAPVAIVEFSDFQCSFCKRFWSDTLPRLKEGYIKKGQVRFVYRHFAILGKQSVEAAKAAECAGEQGTFWEYHDRLFKNQGGLAFRKAKLKQYAQEINLKAPSFNQCLGSDKYLKKIEGETAVAGFLGVRGTPTFFVNGRLLVGAQPFELFKTVIEEELKKGRSRQRR